jgi:glycosyltransferase involved in cell wall biosynthesis
MLQKNFSIVHEHARGKMDHKPIKIIRIQSRICIGGPAIHTDILSRYLPPTYQTILIGGAIEPGESCKYDELKLHNVDVRIMPCMKRNLSLLNDIKSFLQLLKIIKREKPDIVHTHTAKAGAVGRLAAYMAGVPIIVHTFHGHTFKHYFGKLKTHGFIYVEKLLGNITNKIITISPLQRRDIVDIYKIAPSHKVSVIPNGFELDKFFSNHRNGVLKKSLSLDKQTHLIGIIGRIVPIKNHFMALDVLKQLLAESENFHLVVVGDGKDRKKVEKYARELKLEDNVHFTGWVNNIEKIYEGLDAVILTSWSEGTPVAIIEAMASHVPVVSTNVGGIMDILPGPYKALTCEAGEPDEMTKQIKKLVFKNAVSSEDVENAYLHAILNYSYKRLINDIDDLYQKLLREKDLV